MSVYSTQHGWGAVVGGKAIKQPGVIMQDLTVSGSGCSPLLLHVCFGRLNRSMQHAQPDGQQLVNTAWPCQRVCRRQLPHTPMQRSLFDGVHRT